ncbi:hypothetical protein ASG66_00005, partial [Bacillus sp. Leaf406]
FSADGSWGISPCESRTSPGNREKSSSFDGLLFLWCFFNSWEMLLVVMLAGCSRMGERFCVERGEECRFKG